MVWPPAEPRSPRMREVNDGYMAGSTPKTPISGFRALAAVAQPAISPPPPIWTMIASRSGLSSSISAATVPWPAMTSTSSKGCTSTRSNWRRMAWA